MNTSKIQKRERDIYGPIHVGKAASRYSVEYGGVIWIFFVVYLFVLNSYEKGRECEVLYQQK